MSRTYRRIGLFHHLTHDTYPHTKEQFHRDACNEYYVNYNSASWWYRSKRNRQLRLINKREIRSCLNTYNEYNAVFTPFIHNAGWDEY